MPGPYRERIYGIAIKIETTSGTDSVPDPTADAIVTVGVPQFTGDYLEPGTRDDVVNGTLITATRTTAAGRFGKVTLRTEVKGSGAPGTMWPALDALLRMAGFSKTVVASTSVRYSTADTGLETASVYCWTLGKLFKLVGAVATFKYSFEAPKRAFFDFEITGRLVADPTETALPALTFSTVLPPLMHSVPATLGAWTSGDTEPLVLRSGGIDAGNVVTDRPSAGATDGLIGYTITDRKANQNWIIEAVSITAFDPFALSKLPGTSQPTSSHQIGTVAGNRLKVFTGTWSLVWPDPGAANALVTYGLKGSLGAGASGAATRELSLLFD
jgi:hypothetical protein